MATDRDDAIVAGVRRAGSPAAMLCVRRGHIYAFDFGPTLAGVLAAADAPPAYARRRTVLDKLLADTAGEAGAEVREGFTITDDPTLTRAGWPYAELSTDPTMATPSVPPTSRVMSLTAEPAPAFPAGSAPMIASVAGPVVNASPAAISAIARTMRPQ